MAAKNFTHPTLYEEIEAISGYYSVVREDRLVFQEREVLCLIYLAIVEKSCCGQGACAYALVPGFISEWKSHVSQEGLPVSKVVPIIDPATQKEITRLIEIEEMVQQVIFQS